MLPDKKFMQEVSGLWPDWTGLLVTHFLALSTLNTITSRQVRLEQCVITVDTYRHNI